MISLEEAKAKLEKNKIDSNLASYLYNYLDNINDFDDGIDRLIKGEAVQYIVGNVDFYGNTIRVNKNVLIPRFETELLVEKTINYIRNKFKDKVNIVDIGTGSGCIAISLKKELDCNMTGVDISLEALEVAKENAKGNLCDIKFVKSNIFKALDGKFDVVISNPPYIRYDEEIEEVVKNNEPHMALYADNRGLYFYEEILKNCSKYLNNNFLIAFEIGREQAQDITEIALKYLRDINISVEKDYSDKDRFIFISSIGRIKG